MLTVKLPEIVVVMAKTKTITLVPLLFVGHFFKVEGKWFRLVKGRFKMKFHGLDLTLNRPKSDPIGKGSSSN